MSNYRTYFAIEKEIRPQGFQVDRSDLILQFTSGRKSGLSQLTPMEYSELPRWMKSKFVNHQPVNTDQDRCNKMRRKIIALFHKMNWKNADGSADIERIEMWSIKSGRLFQVITSPEVDVIEWEGVRHFIQFYRSDLSAKIWKRV